MQHWGEYALSTAFDAISALPLTTKRAVFQTPVHTQRQLQGVAQNRQTWRRISAVPTRLAQQPTMNQRYESPSAAAVS